jgi:hypothetical protein
VGVGHVAVAIGTAKVAPRVNAGWLVFAALLADFLLGILVYLGREHALVPTDHSSKHYLLFVFPYSHGLLPLILWGATLGFLLSLWYRSGRSRVLLVIAALVVSHYLLDGMVHLAGLPVAGQNSRKLGLGLWRHMPLELSLETLMVIVGGVLFWRASAQSSLSRYGVLLVTIFVAVMTWTQFLAVVPPAPNQLIAGWIAFPLVLSGLIHCLDWKRVHAAA